MILVTGGAGFIGTNLVKELNNRGVFSIIVIDDMTDGSKFRNLVHCKIADYIDATVFREAIRTNSFTIQPLAIFHYGAISSTTETNGREMLDANFTYSNELFHWCQDQRVPLIYASSAAVDGNCSNFSEDGKEAPLNYVLANLDSRPSQVVGLRLFNIYGPGEQHKGAMASVVYQFYQKRKALKDIELFDSYDGVEAGQHKRDFVHVEDVDLATEVSSHFGDTDGYIKFIPFPAQLKGNYQNYTCANISKLRRAGAGISFRGLREGIDNYLEWLETNDSCDV
ncbi:NAD-dependent epimerase/dehydratase [Penicillium malachiteum]|uniref:NAD-dependent epimerase/dehydratase n=1 Tax=Penicillium malachiteum TaxID=1324776 RepID=A0AAD6MTH5_9EURO|nr:NAD-dependent epimerase/dehydratase [Penicillium malachiteum]